jgi:hypothetical protein
VAKWTSLVLKVARIQTQQTRSGRTTQQVGEEAGPSQRLPPRGHSVEPLVRPLPLLRLAVQHREGVEKLVTLELREVKSTIPNAAPRGGAVSATMKTTKSPALRRQAPAQRGAHDRCMKQREIGDCKFPRRQLRTLRDFAPLLRLQISYCLLTRLHTSRIKHPLLTCIRCHSLVITKERVTSSKPPQSAAFL